MTLATSTLQQTVAPDAHALPEQPAERPAPQLPEVDGLRLAARSTPAQAGATDGGDWYDVIALPDGRCALSIGDVEGHDAAAAATMRWVRTALRTFARTGAEPGQVLSATNSLLDSLGITLLTTCTYIVLDLERRELTTATAGHVPAVLGLTDGGTRLLAPAPGLPLGVLPDTEYPQETQSLAGVDSLALLTDGLLEGPELPLDSGLQGARTAVGQATGPDPEQLANALVAAAAVIDQQDDATVLAVCLTR
ncbi:PP2C family protein-serine/threonine phosphatase [Kitasatospora kifunensis]|uniref:Serine phosphatase RsbU (Regulator of sigma subunit) n=1 Tax=Kitasatospora kifunensis TaxID=58351 RepID=A0A7W7VYM7_KITKI|nr:PP2C family protein-serine/threonine phosphatase [Kitasatospora kifunensis]MBB4927661.1 serine phosphatase RsbU (regulator of sigma subunit) [Kitasatospora kifunensis]